MPRGECHFLSGIFPGVYAWKPELHVCMYVPTCMQLCMYVSMYYQDFNLKWQTRWWLVCTCCAGSAIQYNTIQYNCISMLHKAQKFSHDRIKDSSEQRTCSWCLGSLHNECLSPDSNPHSQRYRSYGGRTNSEQQNTAIIWKQEHHLFATVFSPVLGLFATALYATVLFATPQSSWS